MFDKSTRTLIAMLFQRGQITEMDGELPDGRHFTISHRTKNLWRDDDYYDAWLAGVYSDDFRGDTVDETLDALEAYIREEAAA